ncbi:MAG: MCE family protein [Bdellovibrionales bacterium]|nr:MCE family protein [Bdellovibrionales bacterium]
MKRRFSPDFAVGVSALLGLLIMIYFSLEVNDTGSLGSKTTTYYAFFDSVSGLVKRTPIEVAGIIVGYIENISLENNKAKIEVKLKRDIKVYDNALLEIKDRGVLGDKFVQLHLGDPSLPVIPSDGTIKNTSSGGGFEEMSAALNEVTKTIRTLLESDNPEGALGHTIVNIRDMTADLRDIVDHNQVRIDEILRNIEMFSKDLSEISRENKDEIKTVLASLGDVAKSLKTSLGKDGNVTHATEKLDQTMASIQNMVEKIERGEGTLGKIINDETTINNINETVEGLNDTLGLFRKIQLGLRYRGEYLTSAGQMQNLIGFTIAPSPDKYLLLELVSAPVGQTRITDTIVNSGGSTISSTQTVQTNDRITLTLLFAKRLLDMTFRFGMIRSEGGAGLDFHLFKDKLVLSMEGFDFNRYNNRAHLRAYATLILYKHLLLTGGVDDFANKTGGKNAFFGAGIQFTENDLKALIPVLGGLN